MSVGPRLRDVCFALQNGHSPTRFLCPLCANNGICYPFSFLPLRRRTDARWSPRELIESPEIATSSAKVTNFDIPRWLSFGKE